MTIKMRTHSHCRVWKWLPFIVAAAVLSVISQPVWAQEGSEWSADPSLRKAAVLDSIHRAWTAPDSLGRRYYWFRHSFDIDEQPTAGHILIAADDNYSLFINGVFIAEDPVDALDWMNASRYEIGGALHPGRNVLAVQAYDADGTGKGLRVGLVYETVPDLDKALELMTERETEQAEQMRQQMLAGAPKEAPPPTEDNSAQQKLRDMRIIEKNKLY